MGGLGRRHDRSDGRPQRECHVCSDPLSGLADGARTLLYAALTVGGLVLTAAGMMLSASSPGSRPLGGFVVRTYSCVSLAGLLGLLLDYRDGPVRTVQLIAAMLDTKKQHAQSPRVATHER